MDLFDLVFGVSEEDIEFELRESSLIPWAEYWLNPRQLRGSDFLMRWSQGVWSENRLREALNQTGEFYALPYGPSGTVRWSRFDGHETLLAESLNPYEKNISQICQ
ncbi:MAG TPA: hypothetical protein PLD20_21465 [Blastocatellia bacterium]|nr:hypothetical protein [Blastocatellia bacterium]